MAWLQPGREGNKTVRQLFEEESVFRHHSGIDSHLLDANSVCKREEQVINIWRSSVAQWYYDVIDHLNAPRESVYVAMNFLDRAVDRHHQEQHRSQNPRLMEDLTKEGYELLSTTCLFLAIRVSSSFQLKMDQLLRMIDSQFQPKDLQQQGAWLLECPSFKQIVVSPVAFAKAFLRVLVNDAPASGLDAQKAISLLETVTYLLELSVCDPAFARVPASELAYAAIAACLRHRNHDIAEIDLQHALTQLNEETETYFPASPICDRSALMERITSMIRMQYQNNPRLNHLQHPQHEVNDHLDEHRGELHIIDDDDDDEDDTLKSPSSSPRLLSTSLPARLPWSPTLPSMESMAKQQHLHRSHYHHKQFPSSFPK
eukprot:CAMPEP_0176048176 /NCGR_PEP_ID=MMETSP0120_2-20121206/23929_1 /TAXON_ID=160619 /ORGANISM="Kryptoperidinium foliaceum, Strain CCMP 1326" /LENGTH=371 /DNA_ID=CAMNT_0017381591 /DNA_START=224 /DNA_END=1339 /DNA_ORIENTATION=+